MMSVSLSWKETKRKLKGVDEEKCINQQKSSIRYSSKINGISLHSFLLNITTKWWCSKDNSNIHNVISIIGWPMMDLITGDSIRKLDHRHRNTRKTFDYSFWVIVSYLKLINIFFQQRNRKVGVKQLVLHKDIYIDIYIVHWY